MKKNDFGFFQQHAEKIALGCGLAVLLGVAVTQFVLGGSNNVELGNQTVAPGDIRDTVMAQAERLEASLDRGSPLEERPIPRYTDSFNKLYELPVASDQPLSYFDQGPLAKNWVKVVSPDYAEKILPRPPVPTEIWVRSSHALLDRNAGNEVAPYLQLIGDRQPADFQYVSVRTRFSFEEWRNRLQNQNVPAASRIEEGLWRDRLAVTGVRLLREEKDPTTGEWGNRTVIAPLPGPSANVPDEDSISADMTVDQASGLESWILNNQLAFQQPSFPPIQNGPWVPPSPTDRQLTSEQLQKRQDLTSEIERLRRQLDRQSGDNQNGASNRGGRRAPRGGPADEFEDFGGFDDPAPERRRSDRRDRGQNEQTDPDEARRRNVEQRLQDAQRELDELLGVETDGQTRQQEQFGGGFDEFGGDPYSNGPRRPGNARGGNFSGTTSDRVTVWAHDLTVEPGKTYRYKLFVEVLNPLFRNPRLNPDQRKINRTRVSLGPSEEELDEAPWSPELRIDPDYYFFALTGSRDTKRASFEVWTVYDGLWRKSEFTEFPGDEIGGTAQVAGVQNPVPMNAGPILLDVDAVSVPNNRGSVVRVLYLDSDSGEIRTRLVNDDKNSEDRQRLEIQLQQQQQQQDAGRNPQFGDSRRY